MGFLEDIDDLQRTQQLLASGRPGRATIAALRAVPSPAGPADEATCEFDLEVEVDGAAAYRVTHRQSVTEPELSSYATGVTVPVLVDPLDPQHLVIQ